MAGGICSEPEVIENGHVSVLDGSQQHLQYQCDKGYLLWGQPDLICGADNTWSSPPPQCKPLSCGYPHVEDPHALVEKSPYTIQRSQGAGIGDEASLVCQVGFQMVISTSDQVDHRSAMEVVDRIKVVCNKEGLWEKPFPYYCHNTTTTKVSEGLSRIKYIGELLLCFYRCRRLLRSHLLPLFKRLPTLYYPSYFSFCSSCC